MDDKQDASPPPSRRVVLLDRIGISEKRQLALASFLGWFKQPSNLLSVAAIVAVVIVPWIEKVVKSDEELRTKIDSLLETTNKVIAMNQQRASPSGADALGNAILAAQRENELARANAIAEPIKHDVYPAVLFALSNELCASGRFEEAQGYLHDVLKRGTGIHFLSNRPSTEELSNAHVVSAHCFSEQSQAGGKSSAQYKSLADAEMGAAVALLGNNQSDRMLGQRAIIYAGWGELDERMGDQTQSQWHRQQAREIVKKMRFIDPTVMTIVGESAPVAPLPSATLKESALPRSPEGDTYLVSFPDDPDYAAALILKPPDARGEYDAAGSLYLYQRSLFTEADDIFNVTSIKGTPGLTGIGFQPSIPTGPVSPGKPRIQLVWTIERFDKDSIMGVQSRLGQPPRRFVARLSASHQAETAVAQH